MMVLGSVLFWIGLIVWITGEVRLLALAYRQSLVWFFGCLFVPFVSWIFFLLNVKQAWKSVVVATVGFILTGTGYCISRLACEEERLHVVMPNKALQPTAAGPRGFDRNMKFDCQVCIGKSGSAAVAELGR